VELYPNPFDKILLASESAKVAKQVTTKEEGIGEDLTYNLILWREHAVEAVCQLHPTLASAEDRIPRTLEVVKTARLGFAVDAVTFIAEGYCATDPESVKRGVPLAAQFIENRGVRECLTLTHLEKGVTEIVALPYVYDVGRVVRFDEALRYPTHSTNNEFLVAIHRMLEMSPDRQMLDDATWRDSVAEEIEVWGFRVHHDVRFLNGD
jgi:hypothetical protein